MALLRRPTVSSDLDNIDTGVNSKAKSHVTLRRAVLEEIGNRVTTRPTQVAKKAQNIKVPVQPTKTTNVNKQLKPTASVKPVQVKMLTPKGGAKKNVYKGTLVNVAQAVVHHNQKCLEADGNHFEHLL